MISLREFQKSSKNPHSSSPDRLLNVITRTPVTVLNPELDIPESDQRPQRKKGRDRYEDANLGYGDAPPEEVLENALVDNVLELEEKIYAGSLGSLSVKDRKAWRTMLTERRYEKLAGGKLEDGDGSLKVKKEKVSCGGAYFRLFSLFHVYL